MKRIVLIVLLFCSIKLIGQENKLNNENFIGIWEYVKTINKKLHIDIMENYCSCHIIFLILKQHHYIH